MFGGALMLVLGALVAGNGYGWGTWKTVFTQGPSRLSVVVGSLAALTAFVVGTVLATLALCFGLSLLVAAVESQARRVAGRRETSGSLGAGFLVMEMWALIGYLLGTLARGPALSVGLGLVWALVVENLLRGVGDAPRAGRGVHQDPAGHRRGVPGRLDRRHRWPGRDARRARCADRWAGDRALLAYLVLTPLLDGLAGHPARRGLSQPIAGICSPASTANVNVFAVGATGQVANSV